MATCKDCLYFKRCVVLGVELDIKHNKEADKNCRHFKNTADFVEVKHGKWKPTKIPAYFGGVIYECSVCGAKDGDHTQILGKYCWRCGAKMDGRSDT